MAWLMYELLPLNKILIYKCSCNEVTNKQNYMKLQIINVNKSATSVGDIKSKN